MATIFRPDELLSNADWPKRTDDHLEELMHPPTGGPQLSDEEFAALEREVEQMDEQRRETEG